MIIDIDANQAFIIDFGLMCTENDVRRFQFHAAKDDPSLFWQHAPEVFTSSSEKIRAAHAQDIYSLGMILINTFELFLLNTYINTPSSDTALTIHLVHSKLTNANPLRRWSIAKAIYMLATTFFSQIPRLFWLIQNDDNTQIQLNNDVMMTSIWKTTSILALQYCAKKLEDEQKKLSTPQKKISHKIEKIAGIKKLQSEIVVSSPTLFSDRVKITKKSFPHLTTGIFLKRTGRLLEEIAETARVMH